MRGAPDDRDIGDKISKRQEDLNLSPLLAADDNISIKWVCRAIENNFTANYYTTIRFWIILRDYYYRYLLFPKKIALVQTDNFCYDKRSKSTDIKIEWYQNEKERNIHKIDS